MIDIDKCKRIFQTYVNQFDITDDKIQLKLIHTYCVMETTQFLVQEEHLSLEDSQLALLIALLHDIGRFEQLKQYHSFDDRLIDHGKLGIQLLFDQGMIKDFIDDRQYDDIIYHAIKNHSLYQLPKIDDGRILMHCQLIRDSDKLDNFRVKNVAEISTLFDIDEETFINQRVSHNILQDIYHHRLILKDDRHNEVDMWVSYFAFIFDLNFPSSFLFLKQHDYIRQNIDRFDYCPGLQEDMDIVKNECLKYIDFKIQA